MLIEPLSVDPKQLSVLDAGCGGGILSEEFARLGCHVTGMDPAAASLKAASQHASGEGLRIGYCQARGEDLPLVDACFDAVLCCDVLEHVDDYKQLLGEVARALKPGGVLFYDTINRTERSRLENILVAQDFPLTSFFPRHTHVWEKFIRPEELLAAFQPLGLKNRDMTGLRPGVSNSRVAVLLVQRKLGLLSFAELGRRLKFTTGGDLKASYLGWAVKG